MRKIDELPDECVTIDGNYYVISNMVVPDDTTYKIEVDITAKWIGGGAGAAGDNYTSKIVGIFSNTSGSVNAPLTPGIIYEDGTQKDPSTHDLLWLWQFDITGRNLRLRVRGVSDNIILWNVYKIITVL